MPEKDQSEIKGLRTLQTDVQELEKRGISFADIAAETEKRGGLTARKTGKFSPQKIIIISLAIIVIVGLISGSLWLFIKNRQEDQSVSLGPKPILVSDEQVVATDLKSIQSALKTPIRLNNLLHVSMTMGSEEFFKTIKANPPLELTDSLTDRFMLSKFYLSRDWPILIFKIRSYELAFSGMIKWEKTMSSDLNEIFFPARPGYSFQDKEIQNHDTRVLNDESGDSVLIYSFVNRNYLVIVQNEEPIKEIFRRFFSPQYLND